MVNGQAWQQINDSPFTDDHTNGFGFDGKAYVFQGIPSGNGNQSANQVWVYDPEMDSWEILTNFPGTPRRISIGDDWDGKYYYGFGLGGPDGALNDLWVFDPVDTSFTQLPSCPCIGRSHPSLIAHNDKIFMGAGSSANGDLKDWWEYDILTQQWTQKEDIPGDDRHHMFHFSSGDYVYVGGGHVSNWNRYDPENEVWTPIDDLPQGRVAGTQFNYNGLGFILAGDDATHTHVPDFETFMYFNPDSQEWDYLPELPNGSRWAPSSFIIEDYLYFMGGVSDIINGDASMWKFDLSLLNCLPANNLNAVDVDDVSAGLFWTRNTNSTSDTLKWRVVGEEVWNVVPNAEAVYMLNDLEACQDYEFQVISLCDMEMTSSDVFAFKTDGCCVNPDLTVTNVSINSATVSWPDILAATEYNVRWKGVNDADWNVEVVSTSPLELDNLDECTEYEFQIESLCTNDDIDYSESVRFLTGNCGTCLDAEYCDISNGNEFGFAFINKIGINGYSNESGDNNGFGNFDQSSFEELIKGESFTFVFEPGFGGNTFFLDVFVWIDLNGDAIFDDSELVLEEIIVGSEITREILIPSTAEVGLTRMRVFYTINAEPCTAIGDFGVGEAEDYCVRIAESTTSAYDLSTSDYALNVFPNPFKDKILVDLGLTTGDEFVLKIIGIDGKVFYVNDTFSSKDEVVLSSEIPDGIYFLHIENDEQIFKKRIVKQN